FRRDTYRVGAHFGLAGFSPGCRSLSPAGGVKTGGAFTAGDFSTGDFSLSVGASRTASGGGTAASLGSFVSATSDSLGFFRWRSAGRGVQRCENWPGRAT